MTESNVIPDVNPIESSVADLAYVAVKAIGLWYAVSGVETFLLTFAVYWPMIDSRSPNGLRVASLITPLLIHAGIGVLLLIYAKPISQWAFRINGGTRIGGQATRIVALVTVGTGIYWLATGCSLLALTAVRSLLHMRAVNIGNPDGLQASRALDTVDDIYRPLIYLLLGGFLFFRPAWIVGQWQKRVHMPVTA